MKRVTQREVAEAAGCSQMTVSRVLRGDNCVAAETRRKVQEFARDMVYVPDPMLSALVSYKRGSKARHLNANIALIEIGPATGKPMLTDVAFPLIQAGVMKRAREMGFGIEVFDSAPVGLSPQRLKSVLISRGVRGVIWTTTRSSLHPAEPPIDVAGLCAVTVAFDFTGDALNSINLDYHQAVRLAIRQAIERGYRRIGLAVGKGHDIREHHAHTEAYWQLSKTCPDCTFLEPLLFEETSVLPGEAFPAWFERHRPDVVVTGMDGMARLQKYCDGVGLRIPDDVAFVSLDVVESLNAEASGIRCLREHLGEIAVESIYAMMATGEFGLPRHARKILIKPEWNEGTTLPIRVR